MRRKAALAGLHAAWWIVFAMALALFLVSKWEGYALLQTACGPAEHCDNSFRLTADAAEDLARYGLSLPLYGGLLVLFMAIANLSYFAVGLVLYRYGSRSGFGIAASIFLIVIGTIFCTDEHAVAGYPLLPAFFRALDGVGSFYLPVLFLFPNGRLYPRWTVVPAAAWVAAQSFRFAFPEAWSALNWSPAFMTALLLATHGPLLYSLALRYRLAATAAERRLLKWFLLGALGYIGGGSMLALSFALGDGLLQFVCLIAFFAGLLFWPFPVGIAVLDGESDSVSAKLHRALLLPVFGFLVVLLYAAAVGGLGMLLRERDVLISALAGGLIAVASHPLYVKLRQGVNRLVYGEPETPYRILARLTERMEHLAERRAVWDDVAEGLAQALRLPYVAIWAGPDGEARRLAEYGQPAVRIKEMPLEWNGRRLGEIRLGFIRERSALSAETEELLRHLVGRISAAMHESQLAEELRLSRDKLVTAREEERRRLGRDLHDGLGAGLASLVLRADAIADRYAHEPELAAELSAIQDGIEEAVADIRRIVYSLRPPALDEFGLLAAIRELALRYEGAGIRVAMQAPERLPPLGAAAEVAVYRIVQEAIANAVRHGNAGRCRIALDIEAGGLALAVEDDGRGIDRAAVAGVGIRSMKERAEELGGRFELSSREGRGTAVKAFIPYAQGGERIGTA